MQDLHGLSHNFSQSASAARRTWAISIGRPSPCPATTMTMSQFGNVPRACRNDSRTWRLARLRSVARRNTLRGATIPSRGTHILFRAATRRNGPLRRRRRGLRKTRSNSGLRVSRTPAGNRLPDTDGTGTASPFLSTRMIGFASSGRSRRRSGHPVLEWVSSRCYTDSLFRPFARRAASTLRPLRVAMRARKPCVRLRLITLG